MKLKISNFGSRIKANGISTAENVYESQNNGDYLLGVTLILVSAITFSTAGLFTKGVEASAWEVIFWRGIFAALFTILWVNKNDSFRPNFLDMGYSGLFVAIIGAMGTAAFIQSFKFTSIANVSLIYATSPLVAAALAWILISEKSSKTTLMGCCVALIGVIIIVSGSLGQLHVQGDLLALVMTVVMATIMVTYRKYPNTPSAGPAALSSILLLPVCMFFASPLQTSFHEILILGAFGLLFAIASITLVEGAKRVPSGQTALLSSLETPLAPVFAFFLFSEVPGLATLVGGSLICVAVVASIRSRP